MTNVQKTASSPADARLQKRYAKERRFKTYGRLALIIAASMLLFLLVSITGAGVKGMMQVTATLHFSPELQAEKLSINAAVKRALNEQFPQAGSRIQKRLLYGLLAPDPSHFVGESYGESITVPLSSSAELWIKNGAEETTVARFGLKPEQISWLKTMEQNGQLTTRLNTGFFTNSDSRDPERAGFGGSVLGSLFVLFACLAVSLPVGVATAIYLEEFAPKSRLRDIIEININNLAAIPSIIFGLLGLYLYIVLLGLPRSSGLVGGLTLSLMTLPVIIISTRLALAAVPSTLRDAARAIGASPLQVVLHHVLPQAIPGIITGTILGMARAIGETAPLLMIGMVAFIATPPRGWSDPATAMPVQIYLWASSPEPGFIEKTASGIIVLILILLCLNGLATYIRRKSEHH